MVDVIRPFSTEHFEFHGTETYHSVVDAPSTYFAPNGATYANGFGVNIANVSATNPLIVSYNTPDGALTETITGNLANAWVSTPWTCKYFSKDWDNGANLAGSYSVHQSPPTHGHIYPRWHNALLHFDNNLLDDYGNTWIPVNAPTYSRGAMQGSSATSALSLNGTNQYIYTNDITSLCQGHYDNNSFEIELKFKISAFPAAGAQKPLVHLHHPNLSASGFGLLLCVQNFTGSNKVTLYCSDSAGGAWTIASGLVGTGPVLALNTWYSVRLVQDDFNRTIGVYLSTASTLDANGVVTSWGAETYIINAGYTANYSPSTHGKWLGVGAFPLSAPTTFFAGTVDEFRFSSFIRSSMVKTPQVTPYTVEGHWYDKNNKIMYQISGPSTSAGTDPQMIPVNRVFLGKCNTNGTGIVDIDQYDLRNKFGDSCHISMSCSNFATLWSGSAAGWTVSSQILQPESIGNAGTSAIFSGADSSITIMESGFYRIEYGGYGNGATVAGGVFLVGVARNGIVPDNEGGLYAGNLSAYASAMQYVNSGCTRYMTAGTKLQWCFYKNAMTGYVAGYPLNYLKVVKV